MALGWCDSLPLGCKALQASLPEFSHFFNVSWLVLPTEAPLEYLRVWLHRAQRHNNEEIPHIIKFYKTEAEVKAINKQNLHSVQFLRLAQSSYLVVRAPLLYLPFCGNVEDTAFSFNSLSSNLYVPLLRHTAGFSTENQITEVSPNHWETQLLILRRFRKEIHVIYIPLKYRRHTGILVSQYELTKIC